MHLQSAIAERKKSSEGVQASFCGRAYALHRRLSILLSSKGVDGR